MLVISKFLSCQTVSERGCTDLLHILLSKVLLLLLYRLCYLFEGLIVSSIIRLRIA